MYLMLKGTVNTGVVKETSSRIMYYNHWIMLEGLKRTISRNSPKSWLYTFKCPEAGNIRSLVYMDL